MPIALDDNISAVDWNCLATVVERAPLGKREPHALQSAFTNSTVCCFAWDGPKLIGAGRALSDRTKFAMIFDVVLLPEYQGQGIGKQIMNFLIARTQSQNVFLYAVPGKEGFYRKFGFRKMKTAMALFENPERRELMGYLEQSD
jgi:ribosomal protein S18 acetylase RimI-like enzyme